MSFIWVPVRAPIFNPVYYYVKINPVVFHITLSVPNSRINTINLQQTLISVVLLLVLCKRERVGSVG